jgi:lauroyl/myristoyl acyltransferase
MALRRGTYLGLLADQKIPVPFFGRPAMTAPALAVLALRFDCDVLPLRVERLDGAHFRVTVFPRLPLPRSGEPHADAAADGRGQRNLGGVDPRSPPSNGSGCTDAGRIS